MWVGACHNVREDRNAKNRRAVGFTEFIEFVGLGAVDLTPAPSQCVKGRIWPGAWASIMKSRVIRLRVPANLDELAALSAQEQHTDKATAFRQWLHRGAAEYVVKLVAEGRISVGRAAELLDVTVTTYTAWPKPRASSWAPRTANVDALAS